MRLRPARPRHVRGLDPTPFATHHFALQDMESAYETFANAEETGALKVVLTR